MRVLSKNQANGLLRPLRLEIGPWNGLNDVGSEKSSYRVYIAPQDARELYVLAGHVVDWLAPKGWVLLQVDNSTAPFEDEERVFERLVFSGERRWDVETQRSILFDSLAAGDPMVLREQLILLTFFVLIFQWHVYVTCETAGPGQRLGLQDGAIYFLGDADLMRRAEAIMRGYIEDPLRLSQPK